MQRIHTKDLEKWHELQLQVLNGWHLSENDWNELIIINHLVMEVSNEIHKYVETIRK